jgi:hypothetical protein
MKRHRRTSDFQDEGETTAYFGEARLIRFLDGRFELHGGSEADRAAAREWIAAFLRNTPVRERP